MQTCAKVLVKKVIPFAIAGILLLAGCDKGEAPPQSREPVVSVVTVGTQNLTLTNEMTGRTVPYRIAEIRPQVNGIILERLFEEGSQVEKGQTLYLIDPAPYQVALDNAEANLAAIQLRKDRFEDLLPDHAVSQQDYDDAVAGVKSWQAQVKAARINLDYTNLTAPISGRIGRSNVTEGAIVTAYQPVYLATIQQLDPMYVDIPQSTAEVQRLRRELAGGTLNQSGTGQNIVRLVEEDGVVYPLEGTLQFRDISVNPTTGSVILRAVFPNPNGTLLPQMFVRALVNEGVSENAILVPQQGVSRDSKGDPFAWIVDAEGQTQIRELVLDRAIGDKWLVTEGLAAGDQLIVEGLQSLRRPGTPIQVVPFDPGAGHGGAPGGPSAGSNGGRDKQSTPNTAQPE
ncbi:MAG: efflux RND transporter periplasmic adaptor subunit [Candidatus Krumholzibacteria bacterium]|nr:efflux RND transporter periplasmic adaptor subunit [Candidatus Krumholzibacteria bacterium]